MKKLVQNNTLFIMFFFLLLILIQSCKDSSKESSTKNKNKLSQHSSPNEGGELYARWPVEKLPIKIHLSDDYNREETILIEEMIEKWNQAKDAKSQNKIFFNLENEVILNPNHENYLNYKDEVIGVYKSYHWFDNVNTNALAITIYFGRIKQAGTVNEHIELEHGDIIVNFRDFNFDTENPPLSGSYDLGTVLLHELGHLIGLPHEFENLPSIMASSINKITENRKIFPSDDLTLMKNYPALYQKLQTQIKQQEDKNMNNNNNLHPRENRPVYRVIELTKENCQVLF